MTKLYLNLVATLRQLTNREEGAGLAEYGLLLALIAVACVVALGDLGTAISDTLDSVAGSL
ncbi:MAG: Flp family type IVb pilin [Chloroflexi bacterium]|nr:Flp family type IVb pilin [Chloroflexota bacterium]